MKFKIFFSRTTLPISTKLGINYSWVRGLKFVQMKGLTLFKEEKVPKSIKLGTNYPWVKGIIDLSENTLVSDVAHGPLVIYTTDVEVLTIKCSRVVLPYTKNKQSTKHPWV